MLSRKVLGLVIVVIVIVFILIVAGAVLDQGSKGGNSITPGNPANPTNRTAAVPISSIGLKTIASGLTHPIGIKQPSTGDDRLYIYDQSGVVYSLNTTDGKMTPFLDISDRIVKLDPNNDERGLLGLAFHPNYAQNGRFYVFYSAPLRPGAPSGWDCTSTISEFRANGTTADPMSERIILQVDKPQPNHNGGDINFGPDGFLYIPMGDGGAGFDTGLGHNPQIGNGQDLMTMLGKILRVDVDGTAKGNYSVPADNPFVGNSTVLPEIYAYGFRNPAYLSFDQGGDNSLFVSDAGQDRREEIDIVIKGGDYGWPFKEGTYCLRTGQCDQGVNGEQLIDPIIEYTNLAQPGGFGIVIIGGQVYRGSELPNANGLYFFGDYAGNRGGASGLVLAAAPPSTAKGTWSTGLLDIRYVGQGNTTFPDLGYYLLGFGQDRNGEMYVLTAANAGPTGSTGKVFKIVP